MMAAARVVSWLALAGTIGPAVMFFSGRLSLDQTQLVMLGTAVLWFATAPLWMDRGTNP